MRNKIIYVFLFTQTVLFSQSSLINVKQLHQSGATTGQILKWDGTSWIPETPSGSTITGSDGIEVVGSDVRLGNNTSVTGTVGQFTQHRSIPLNNKGLYVGDATATGLFAVDGLTDKVGIGTDAPTRTLHVEATNTHPYVATIQKNGFSGNTFLMINSGNAASNFSGIEFQSGSATRSYFESSNAFTNFKTDNANPLNIGTFATNTATSGNYSILSVSRSGQTEAFAPSSGNASLSILDITPQIMQTGTASGITRGIRVHYDETAMTAPDFRAIEITGLGSGYGFRCDGTNVKHTLTGRLGLGTGSQLPTEALDVFEGARFRAAIKDVNNSAGTTGQVLSSTGTAVDWVNVASSYLINKEVTVIAMPSTSGIIDNGFVRVPSELSGWDLVKVDYGFLDVPTSGTDYVIRTNMNSGGATSTGVTIQASQVGFESETLSTGFTNLATGDLLRTEVVTAGTCIPTGLVVTYTFKKP